MCCWRKFILVISDWIVALLHPSTWIQVEHYSAEWDAELKRLMRTERFVFVDPYRSKIGNHILWTENHPYGSFVVCRLGVRPRRATILRAEEKRIRDTLTDNENPITERE